MEEFNNNKTQKQNKQTNIIQDNNQEQNENLQNKETLENSNNLDSSEIQNDVDIDQNEYLQDDLDMSQQTSSNIIVMNSSNNIQDQNIISDNNNIESQLKNSDHANNSQNIQQQENSQNQDQMTQLIQQLDDEEEASQNFGVNQFLNKINLIKDNQQINDINEIQDEFDKNYPTLYQNPENHLFLQETEQFLNNINKEFQQSNIQQQQIDNRQNNQNFLNTDSFEQELQNDKQFDNHNFKINDSELLNLNNNNSQLNELDASLQLKSIEMSECNTSKSSQNKSNISQSKSSVMFTGKSIKPSAYIPEAIKKKFDVLILNMHKELQVLSHQKLVLVWVAARVFSEKHVQFWKELIQSYGGHIHLKRYGSMNAHNQFESDLKKGQFATNPIILMVSGFCGSTLVPKIYSQYRFKGIIVYTDKVGLKLNEQWIKKYPRVVLLTDDKAKAQKMLHNLVNNTLFRGAVKFKDLDHFLGRKKTVQDYILPYQQLEDLQIKKNISDIKEDQEEYNDINDQEEDDEQDQENQEEEKFQKKQQKKQTKEEINLLEEDIDINNLSKQQQQKLKQMNPYEKKKFFDKIKKNQKNQQKKQNEVQLLSNFQWDQKNRKYIPLNNDQQFIKKPWNNSFSNPKEKKIAMGKYYKQRTPNEIKIIEDCQKLIPGPFIINTFHGVKISEGYHFQNLLKCKQIVEEKKVLIRTNMLEPPLLKKMAELFSNCFEVSDNPENLKDKSSNCATLNLDNNTMSFEKEELEYEIAVKILKYYTMHETDFYALINCALNTINEELIFQLQTMITAVRFAHNLYDDTGDTIFKDGEVVNIYRGCTFDKEYFSGFFRKNEHIVFPAFTSTTIDIDQAKKYGLHGTEKRIIFQIQCVCDDDMMQFRPKNLKSISKYPEESEYLMNCFSLLYIEDIDPDWEGGYLLYKLKLLR